MRRILLLSGALAPLCAVCAPATAQTVISNERTTPVQTSTVNNGAADNVRIASSGALRPTSGAAITIDSNNTVANEGTISINNSNGAVGVLIQGGRQGSFSNAGVISIVEDYTPTDSDNDGDLDGPFTQGSGRYGVRVTGGASPFVGSITQATAASITVEGADSFGVSIEPGLTGDVSLLGQINVLGNRSKGLSVTGPVTGNVLVNTMNVVGEGAVGVDIAGALGGRLVINNAVAVTGYRSTARPADVSKLDADDLLQGGPAVRVAADVAGGVVVDTRPTDLNPTDPDEDKDGVPDAQETAAAIRSFGGSPALLVAGAERNITIGALGASDGSVAVRGTVAASGVYDGVAATAIQIGGQGGGTTRLTSGLRVTGTVESAAVRADAVGVRLGAGANVSELNFASGGVAAAVTGGTGAARGVIIEQGATAPILRNNGQLQVAVAGAVSDAVAVEDRSGTLRVVENTRTISTVRNLAAGDPAVTGRAIALNLSANTSGVNLTQRGVTDGDDGGDNVPDPDADGDGVDDADEPAIVGDILLGSGADSVEILNGTVSGAISFGAGADRLLIDGGARVVSAISDGDGLLTMEVRKGTLELANTQALRMTSLQVGTDGAMVFAINPNTPEIAAVQVSGAATFAAGSEVGVRLTSLLNQPQRFTLLQAGTLTASGLQTTVDTPYLFQTALTVNSQANSLVLDVRRRTAAEAGLNRAQTGAFDAVYAALGQDTELRNAFLGQTDRAGFIKLYDQLLPEHAGGVFYGMATGARALSSALVERTTTNADDFGGWAQEVAYRAERDAGDDAGFQSGGFGFMAGFDVPALGGATGLSVAFTTAEVEDDASTALEDFSATALEAGVYYRANFGRLTTAVRAAIGRASFESERQLSFGPLTRSSAAEWSGLTATGFVGASYLVSLGGRFHIRPEANVDAFLLREDAHNETGAGAGFDLQLEERSSHMVSGSALLNLGAKVGPVTPELVVGWRQTLSGGVDDTIARFGASGTPFTVQAADAPSGAAVAGFRLTGGTGWSFVSLQARAEAGDDHVAGDVRLNVRFVF